MLNIHTKMKTKKKENATQGMLVTLNLKEWQNGCRFPGDTGNYFLFFRGDFFFEVEFIFSGSRVKRNDINQLKIAEMFKFEFCRGRVIPLACTSINRGRVADGGSLRHTYHTHK